MGSRQTSADTLISCTSEITMPTALPSVNPYKETAQFVIRCAYDRCLDLETRHMEVPKHGRLDVLVCARMLGYMLLEAPTEEGRMDFASEVVRCGHDGDKALQSLAELYKDHLFRVCKSPTYMCASLSLSSNIPVYSRKGRTPTSSHHPSAPSFDLKKEQYTNPLQATPPSHARSKQQASCKPA